MVHYLNQSPYMIYICVETPELTQLTKLTEMWPPPTYKPLCPFSKCEYNLICGETEQKIQILIYVLIILVTDES